MDDEEIGRSLVGSWSVDDIGGAAVLVEAQPTIEFGDDGTMSGTTGTNRFTGRYEVVDATLQSSPLASTRMAGPPAAMEQEARFMGALSIPGAIRLEDAVVTIGEGDAQLRLVRDRGVVR